MPSEKCDVSLEDEGKKKTISTTTVPVTQVSQDLLK